METAPSPSADGWITVVIHTIENIWQYKRNEVLIYAETRTIPENRRRSEKKPVTKGRVLCTALFVRTSRTGKFRQRERWWRCQDWEWGRWERQLQAMGASLREDDIYNLTTLVHSWNHPLLQSSVVLVAQLCEYTKPLKCALEMVNCVACELLLKAVIKNNLRVKLGKAVSAKGTVLQSTLEETTWCPNSRARGLPELSPVGFFYPHMGKTAQSMEHGSMWFKAALQHADQVALKKKKKSVSVPPHKV